MAVEALCIDIKEINEDGSTKNVDEAIHRIQNNLKLIALKHESVKISKKDLVSLIPGVLMLSCSKNKKLRSIVLPYFPFLKDVIHSSKDFTNLDWMSILNQEYITRFTVKLVSIVEEGSEEWIEPWLLVVETMVTTMVSEDRVISGTVMNILLRVAEKAFKVAKQKPVLLETVFNTWKRFIDIFSVFKKVLNTKKILGLLLVPLTSVMPESGDQHKLETWYHLVEAIGSHSDMAVEVIVGPFLQFLVQNERMFISFKEKIIFYLSMMTKNKFIKSHCFSHIVSCLKLCIKHKAPVDSIVSTFTTITESIRSLDQSEEYYSLLFSILEECKSQEVELKISMCKVALEQNLLNFKPSHVNSLIALIEKIFPEVMPDERFRTDVFYPLTSGIHNMACLSTNDRNEKKNYDNILVPWHCLTDQFLTYAKDSTTEFQGTSIDTKILKMLLITPLYIPFKSWNNKRYIEKVSGAVGVVKNNCDEATQCDLIVQLEEGVKTSKMDISSCLHLAKSFDNCNQIVSFMAAVSKEIVGAQPEQVVLFLTVLEMATSHESTEMKTNFKAPLTCLLKVCPSYLPPYDHKVKALASKLLRRLSSLEKEVNKNSAEHEERKGVRSPLMAHSNFLHRLSIAEGKKNNKKISMASMFPTATNGTVEEKSDSTLSNKENKLNSDLNRSPSLKGSGGLSSDDQAPKLSNTNGFLSDSEGTELITHFKVTTDLHRVPSSPKLEGAAVAPQQGLGAKSPSSPCTFREALAQSPIPSKSASAASPNRVKSISSPFRTQKTESPGSKLTPSRSKKQPTYFDDSIDSQEFVFVPPKQKERPLTAHQKEVLKERSVDIPALYQDLSQDTQEMGSQDSSSLFVLASENDVNKKTGNPLVPSEGEVCSEKSNDVRSLKSPLKKSPSPKKSPFRLINPVKTEECHDIAPTGSEATDETDLEKMKTPLSVRRLNFEGACGDVQTPLDDSIRRSSRKSTSKYKQPSGETPTKQNNAKKRKSLKTEVEKEANSEKDLDAGDGKQNDATEEESPTPIKGRKKRKISQISEVVPLKNATDLVKKQPAAVRGKKKITSRDLTEEMTQTKAVKKNRRTNSPLSELHPASEKESNHAEKGDNIIKQCENCGEVNSLALDINGTTVQPIKHKKGCPACVVKKIKTALQEENPAKDEKPISKPAVNKKSTASSQTNKPSKPVIKKQNSAVKNKDIQMKKNIKLKKIIKDSEAKLTSDIEVDVKELGDSEIHNTKPFTVDPAKEIENGSSVDESVPEEKIDADDVVVNGDTEGVLPSSESQVASVTPSSEKVRKRKNKANKFSPEQMRKRFSLNRSPKRTRAMKSIQNEMKRIDTDPAVPETTSSDSVKPIEPLISEVQESPVVTDAQQPDTETVLESDAKQISKSETESITETHSEPDASPVEIKEAQPSLDSKPVKRGKRKLSISKSEDPKRIKTIKEGGSQNEIPTKAPPKMKRSVNSNLDQWLLKGRISKSPEPVKTAEESAGETNFDELETSLEVKSNEMEETSVEVEPTEIENSLDGEPAETETSLEAEPKEMIPSASIIPDSPIKDAATTESQSLLDDSQELIESSQETFVSELLTPVKVAVESIECCITNSEPVPEAKPAETASSEVESCDLPPVEQVESDPQSPSPSIQGILRRTRRIKRVKKATYSWTTEVVTVTPERKKQKQPIKLPSPTTGDNWPRGECQRWVAYCPTPPEASPNVTILKKTSAYQSPSTSPKTTPKKRVGFLDPPVTKGLLYSKDTNDGEVHHAKSVQDDNCGVTQLTENSSCENEEENAPSSGVGVIESSFTMETKQDVFDLGLEKVIGNSNDKEACTVEILDVCSEPASDDSIISVDMEFQMNLDSTVLNESSVISVKENINENTNESSEPITETNQDADAPGSSGQDKDSYEKETNTPLVTNADQSMETDLSIDASEAVHTDQDMETSEGAGTPEAEGTNQDGETNFEEQSPKAIECNEIVNSEGDVPDSSVKSSACNSLDSVLVKEDSPTSAAITEDKSAESINSTDELNSVAVTDNGVSEETISEAALEPSDDKLHSNEIENIPDSKESEAWNCKLSPAKSQECPERSSDSETEDTPIESRMPKIPNDISPIKYSTEIDYSVKELPPHVVKDELLLDTPSVIKSEISIDAPSTKDDVIAAPQEEEEEEILYIEHCQPDDEIIHEPPPQTSDELKHDSPLKEMSTEPVSLDERTNGVGATDDLSGLSIADLKSRLEFFLKHSQGSVTTDLVASVREIHQLTDQFLYKLALSSLK